MKLAPRVSLPLFVPALVVSGVETYQTPLQAVLDALKYE
jgi:hypothetical protein